MEFRQLLPEPGTVEIEALLDSVRATGGEDSGHPHTIANFVSSADGRATLASRSGGLGDDGDRAVFHGLRERVDAVLAGTRTLRTERYGRIISKPERRARRIARGLPPEPLACIITRSGDVPFDIPLFAEPEARVVIFAPRALDTGGCAAQVEVIELDLAELTLTMALRRLRADFGVRLLLCEGGPTMFGALLHEHAVNELFLTIAPKLAGGGNGPTISAGPELADPQRIELKWLLERNGSLYHRYEVT